MIPFGSSFPNKTVRVATLTVSFFSVRVSVLLAREDVTASNKVYYISIHFC